VKYIELFAGIGGFRYGLEVCNDDSKTSRLETRRETSERISQDGTDIEEPAGRHRAFTCVYSNEWNKYAAGIYRYNYGEIDERDITTVPTGDIPTFDLLTGGFPCQAFSVAGKRGGFDDTRGTLFFEVARVLRDCRPRYFILENVKGLLSHDSGKTFHTILGVLADLGYQVEWMVLNSKHFGVPQNRERVFIVGYTGKRGGRKVFPIRGASRENKRMEKFSKSVTSPTLTKRGAGEYHSGMILVKEPRIRRLTPVECERLQAFPDGWTSRGIIDGEEVEISDTQRYKALGNAVTTSVITAIGQALLEFDNV